MKGKTPEAELQPRTYMVAVQPGGPMSRLVDGGWPADCAVRAVDGTPETGVVKVGLATEVEVRAEKSAEEAPPLLQPD